MTGAPSWRVAVFCLAFVATAWVWGSVCVRPALRHGLGQLEFPIVFVAGCALSSVGLLALKLLVPAPGWWLLLALLVGGATTLFLLSGRRQPARSRHIRIELLALVIGLGAATLWSLQHLSPLKPIEGGVAYLPWDDSFVLAEIVTMFKGAQPPQRVGFWEMIGSPTPIYHYASFVVAGAFADFTRTSPLATVDAFLVPLGVTLVALCAYALGACWWGPKGGLLALVATMLLPDASFYGLGNPYFGFFWAQQISSSLCWGVAVATLALLLVTAGAERGDRGLWALGAGFGALCVLVKAHLVPILWPLLLASTLLCVEDLSRRARWVGVVVGITTFVALAFAAREVPGAPTIAIDPGAGLAFFSLAGQSLEPGRVRELWTSLARPEFSIASLPPRGGLLLLAAFGLLPAAFAALLLLRWRRRKARARDLLPLLAMVGFLALALGLAPNRTYTNPFELQHRSFVWVYLLLAVWCSGALLEQLGPRLRVHPGWLAAAALLFPLALADEITGRGVSFGRAHLHTPLPHDLLACLERVRLGSDEYDVLQDSARDPRLITLALAERPAYLARPVSNRRSARLREEVDQRDRRLQELEKASSTERLESLSAGLPIRFYLLHPGSRLAWPDERLAEPTFRCGEYRVYELGGSGD